MFGDFFQNSSQWIGPLGRTVVSIGVAYVLGLLLRDLLVGRLVRIASRTPSDWDDILVSEVRRRVPLWCLLAGAWFSLQFWPLQGSAWAVRTPQLLLALAVGSVTLASASTLTRLVSAYGTRSTSALPITSLTQNLARGLVLLVGLVIVLEVLNVEVKGLITALGVTGLAVALALQETLANLFAGLFVTLAGQVRIGDYIKLDTGAEGYVIDFNWRSARLQVPSGNVIIVPTSKLSQAIVTNYSLPFEDLAVPVELAVDSASDLDHVEKVTCEVAQDVMTKVPGGMADFVPQVRYQALGDGAARFTIVMRAKEHNEVGNVRHEFLKRIRARYEKEGIVMPSGAVVLDRHSRS